MAWRRKVLWWKRKSNNRIPGNNLLYSRKRIWGLVIKTSARFSQNERPFCLKRALVFSIIPLAYGISVKEDDFALQWWNGNCIQRMCGFTEEFLWLACAELTVQLVARGLVIESASARRKSSERSQEKRWGLGVSVQSNKWFCSIKGECQNNRSLSGLDYPMRPYMWSWEFYWTRTRV